MKKVFLCLAFLCWMLTSFTQTIIQKDAEIEQMVSEVNSDSLRSYIKTLVSFGTRNTLSTQTDAHKGIGAARNWVLSKFTAFAKQSNGRMTAYIDTTTLQPDNKTITAATLLGNVAAVLKGTDINDKRIFIISGHLDSRRSDVKDITGDAPGADDDGSGCAAVIECARIISSHSFPSTIIFVTVSGEEQGLFGSTYMANKAKEKNLDIEAVLNNDIIGSNNSNETNLNNNTQVRVFSEGLPAYKTDSTAKLIRQLGLENDGKARQLARYVKETSERYVPNLQVVMIYRNDRFLRGGDHIPYVENGYAAVRITEMNENYFHQHQDVRVETGIHYGDLLQFIDFEYLRKNTCLNLCTLANLAKAPSMPQDVKMEVKQLTNTTTLRWKAPVNGIIKGYYVLMRETTSPIWQTRLFTTGTNFTLPYSKDNYFFAVQAVNKSGNESLPVVSFPEK